ncbi:MAG: SAM-dependent methyltransferase [Porticoccaceae bacterium]|jgi:SAM-dependent methyltransferase
MHLTYKYINGISSLKNIIYLLIVTNNKSSGGAEMALTHGLKIEKSIDQKSKERFCSSLRGYVLNDLATEMRADFEISLAAEGSDLSLLDGTAVHKAIKQRPKFQLYSSLRCAAQELVWHTVIDSINCNAGHIQECGKELIGNGSDSLGSLTLDDALESPDYYSAVDVHLMPGNYQGKNDTGILPGAVYDNGFNVFAFGAMGEDLDDIGCSMANFVRLKFPELKPKVIVDVGCTIGHNTLPWKQVFPDANVSGVDMAAACLKYAHARAESLGIQVDFLQQSSSHLSFADNSVDVVFSSMFLHELPKPYIKQFLAEAHRVLKPGGIMLHMELPPNSALTPYDSFYLDWDSYYNNEPFYKSFRDQDYSKLCSEAGFAPASFFQSVMPRYTYVPEDDFKAVISTEAEFNEDTGRLSNDIQWYGFGSQKL